MHRTVGAIRAHGARVNRREFVAAALAAGSAAITADRGSAAIAADRGGAAMAAERAAGAQAEKPMPFPSVRLLVFDTFGTVVDWRSSVIAEGERLGREKNLSVDWAAFADAWRGGYGPSMNRVRTGELPWTKLDVLHRMVLDQLLEKFDITGLSEEEKDHLNRVWHRLAPWPDAVAGLTRIRTRYVIAPLSNGNFSLLTNMAKRAGIPWDCILSTELVRRYKPDPETYLMPGAFFDLEPSQVMMVAAHNGDLQAAQKLGLRTAYVHRPDEFGPARRPTPPPRDRFDLFASDYGELAELLGT
jgi:2-haloacid dehalogenase